MNYSENFIRLNLIEYYKCALTIPSELGAFIYNLLKLKRIRDNKLAVLFKIKYRK